MQKDILRKIVIEQHEMIDNKAFGILREILIDVQSKIENNHIIVISGIRRCGKSTLLRQIIHKYYNDENYYYVNFDDERFLEFKAQDFDMILEVLIELRGSQKVFFFDEIQNVEGFQHFIRRLHDLDYKIYITGSNANLLSSELSSKLTGRHLDILLFPFSFTEFLTFREYKFEKNAIFTTEGKANFIKWFDEYYTFGGMPEYLQFQDPEVISHVYDDILIKDIGNRYKIQNTHSLKQLGQYLFSNVGSKINFSRLSQMVDMKSPNTIKSYIEYIQNSFLGFLVSKFDYSVKKQIANNKKFYSIDTGFVDRLSTKIVHDKGWVLENIVFLALQRKYRSERIFYLENGFECDFILVPHKSDEKVLTAIQVTYHLSEKNEDREISGIVQTMKKLSLKEGYILTYSQEKEIIIEDLKIVIKPVWKWLVRL